MHFRKGDFHLPFVACLVIFLWRMCAWHSRDAAVIVAAQSQDS
jgi:hypothetical protein